MNSSSEAAETMVKMYLEGVKVIAHISGDSARNVATYLLAVSKGKIKTKGSTSLNNILKSGKPLKVFSISNKDLRKFKDEAKKYGVLFNAIIDKKNTRTDGLIDIIVRGEDAPKINRIVERFKLAAIDTATIRNEVEKSLEERNKVLNTQEALKGKEPQSNISSKPTNNLESKEVKKESVRKKLEDIRKSLASKKSKDKEHSKNHNKKLKKSRKGKNR